MAFPRWSVGTIKVVLLSGFLDLGSLPLVGCISRAWPAPTAPAVLVGAGHARDARAEETKHLCQHLSALKGKRVEKLTSP